MFGAFKFDFKNTEYIDLLCTQCGKKTVHIVRTKDFECTICGNRHD